MTNTDLNNSLFVVYIITGINMDFKNGIVEELHKVQSWGNRLDVKKYKQTRTFCRSVEYLNGLPPPCGSLQ